MGVKQTFFPPCAKIRISRCNPGENTVTPLPSLSPQFLEAAKYALPLLGLLFIGLFAAFRAPRHDFWRGLVLAALFWTTLGAAYCYSHDGWTTRRYLNAYEFFHYYLGSKYAAELGYSDLYESALVALKETGRRDLPATVRDLKAGRPVGQKEALAKAETLKAKFSPARWEEFKGDVRFFRNSFRGAQGWNKMMNDKGYNPAPMWTLAGGTLANLVPTSSPRGMMALALIDVGLMITAAGCVVWAFGPRTAIFLAFVLFTQYVTSHTHMKASFMRMDWIMFLLIAACMIKKQHWKTAGFLLGWAACSRIFPIIFAFGIGAKLLLDLLIDRRINRQYLACLVTCGATILFFAFASWLYTSTAYWQEFLTKIADHNDDISPWRVGFKYVWLLSCRGSGAGSLAQMYTDWSTWYHAIQAGVLLLCIPLARRLEDFEAFCLGIVAVFFLVAPTYYYYIVVLVPALFFAAKLDSWPRAVGLGLILVEGMLAHYGHRVWDRTYPQFFSISVMMMVIVLYLALVAAFAPRASREGADSAQ